uniref:DUF3237 domain-containing protein n=1 Tax=Steinernema glaseri TaxID=37863 RepID=A0A1I8AUZ0_9BILA
PEGLSLVGHPQGDHAAQGQRRFHPPRQEERVFESALQGATQLIGVGPRLYDSVAILEGRSLPHGHILDAKVVLELRLR